MNERIRELRAKALVPIQQKDGYTSWVFSEDKFAELIVRDCVAQCHIIAGQCEFVVTGEMARRTKSTAESCAYMIKQHFGVEE